MDTVKREGILAAYRKVQAKLSEPQALGYSSAGDGRRRRRGDRDRFKIGDRVACAGAGVASHAEMICVPVNLSALVPADVPSITRHSPRWAIALHGVRQAEPTLGERVASSASASSAS